jgi:Leucine-rich repeat (LRR) protein
LALVVLALPIWLPARPAPKKQPEELKLARVIVTGTDKGGSTTRMFRKVGGKLISIRVSTRLLQLNDKSALLVVVPSKKGKNQPALKMGAVYAVEGRLAIEGPGVNTGLSVRPEGLLTVKGNKAVVVLASSVTVLDKKNKNDFPSLGKAAVVGAAMCGQRDLKLFDRPTLSIRNGPTPIVLQGEKARTDAAGKGVIWVTGTLRVDKRGLVRLRADKVMTGLEVSAAARAEDAIEAMGGSVERGEGPGRPVVMVSLSGAKVTDATLVHLEAFPSLERLELSGAEVTDGGLRRVKGLSNLQALSVAQTRITDKGLVHLNGLAKLRALSLLDTRVTNDGLAHLAGLTKLESLNLSNTQVTAKGLERLKGLTKLHTLTLGRPQMTDELLAALARMDRLHTLSRAYSGKTGRPGSAADISSLSLDATPITDAGLAHLKGLTNLKTLYLTGTQVTDAGLPHLKALTKLRTLFLIKTKVTAQGVAELQKALPEATISH